MTNSVNLREVVLDILLEVNENGMYSHVVMNNALKKYQYLEKSERAFITRIAEGTIERQITIDYIIDMFSKVKTAKMKPVIRNIMRMAVYQIMYMDAVPVSAACNEAVKLTVKRGFAGLKGFVNGVLRNIARNKDTIEYSSLSVKYSMPDWIIRKWQECYDENTLVTILEALQEKRDTVIRCNTERCSVDELITELQAEEITVGRSPYVEYALTIDNYDYLDNIKAFREGRFSVQDISSMLVGTVSGIKEGDCVIDVCAAPGGKSLHMAELLNGSGEVIAMDISQSKVDMMKQSIERMKFRNITAKVQDACVYHEELCEKADILLCDLPCSGLGIIGRKADIKYKMTEEKQKELVELQRKILENVYRYVKKGGTLIYSTCTINREENEENVEWLLKNFPFERENLCNLPENLAADTQKSGYIQMLPGVHQTDGFFIARLKRC